MRTLGDLRWLNEYIGIPYIPGGRDRNGLCCYGLAKLVYQEQYGITLPDWSTDDVDLKKNDKIIASVVTSGTFTETDHPEDGDFAVCYRAKAAHHIGLVFGGGVLHCRRGMGTVYEPIPKFNTEFNKVVFGEWNP